MLYLGVSRSLAKLLQFELGVGEFPADTASAFFPTSELFSQGQFFVAIPLCTKLKDGAKVQD